MVLEHQLLERKICLALSPDSRSSANEYNNENSILISPILEPYTKVQEDYVAGEICLTQAEVKKLFQMISDQETEVLVIFTSRYGISKILTFKKNLFFQGPSMT